MRTDEESGQTIIPVWANCTWKFWSIACVVNSVWKPTWRPQVAYRETITRRSKIEGKHVKQSGGGQYGHAVITLEPSGEGKGYQFFDEIKGGVIPREFIPSVEKGIQNTLGSGILAGFPVVDVKVRLTFGSYHDVDSQIAFELAGSMAFKGSHASRRSGDSRADDGRGSGNAGRLHGRRDG